MEFVGFKFKFLQRVVKPFLCVMGFCRARSCGRSMRRYGSRAARSAG